MVVVVKSFKQCFAVSFLLNVVVVGIISVDASFSRKTQRYGQWVAEIIVMEHCILICHLTFYPKPRRPHYFFYEDFDYVETQFRQGSCMVMLKERLLRKIRPNSCIRRNSA